MENQVTKEGFIAVGKEAGIGRWHSERAYHSYTKHGCTHDISVVRAHAQEALPFLQTASLLRLCPPLNLDAPYDPDDPSGEHVTIPE